MNASDVAVAINNVARAWQAGGRSAPVASSATSSAAGCAMPGCTGLAFVELRTVAGTKSLCFTHFESVQADLDG